MPCFKWVIALLGFINYPYPNIHRFKSIFLFLVVYGSLLPTYHYLDWDVALCSERVPLLIKRRGCVSREWYLRVRLRDMINNSLAPRTSFIESFTLYQRECLWPGTAFIPYRAAYWERIDAVQFINLMGALASISAAIPHTSHTAWQINTTDKTEAGHFYWIFSLKISKQLTNIHKFLNWATLHRKQTF